MDKAALFLDDVTASLRDGSFIRLSLGHYRGTADGLKQLHVRPVTIKRQEKLSFTYRYQTRDIVKNYSYGESAALLAQLLAGDFASATLYAATHDLRYDASGKTPRLNRSAASQQAAPRTHDRQKHRPVAAARPYLQALGLTDAQGNVHKHAQDKYRQINKYIEIVSGLLSDLPADAVRRVVDMGSGKGYLTFALYDHLTHTLGREVEVTGVEYRADMVALCNGIAQEQGFTGLRFVEGSIAGYDSTGTDLLIALHACDTATDDAMAKGILAEAKLIIVAPCCHKQVRRAMAKGRAAPDLAFLTRHGTLLERQAEMVTDALRALFLEYHGYSSKLFEFVSDAHTPKNVMLVGTRNRPLHEAGVRERIAAAKQYFGIDHHHLETHLPLQPA